MIITIRRLMALLVTLMLPVTLAAQGDARVTGRVLDVDGGFPLGGARITVDGTTVTTTTAIDGRYTLRNVPAGSVSLRIVKIGYNPKLVTFLTIPNSGVVTQDVTMSMKSVELQEISVTAAVENGTVHSALDEQRKSVGIVNAISREQIARSPDGDAASAAQRVSGATVQDGKYVFVRGLGDRYTQASLNGARIPSPEPEKKVVPLDLFPSALLEGVTVSKTFTPDQPGDFAGASVNIRTREFAGKRFAAFSVSSGFNDAITGKVGSFAPSTGRDILALGAAARQIPALLKGTDFSQQLPAAQTNALIGSLRNVWSPISRSGSPNGGGGLTLGGAIPTGPSEISYLLSGTYGYTQETRASERRALAQIGSTGAAEEVDRYDGTTDRSSVLWGGILNLGYDLGGKSKISWNNSYNRTMDNEGRRESGSSENLALPLDITRLRYVERNVASSQLTVRHEFGGRHLVDYGVNLAQVARKEPDRSEIVYDRSTAVPTWFGFANEGAVRTFADLREHSVEGSANWQFFLGAPEAGLSFKVGGIYRQTNRDAVNTAFSLSLIRPLPEAITSLAPEQIFDGRLTGIGDANLRITPLAAGGSYTASDRLVAGYVMTTLPLSRSLELVTGARIERSNVRVDSRSTAGEPSVARPEFTDLLPSLALNLKLGEMTNLRLSGTQTLSRPEYRELSPILFREVIGFDNVKGNPDLQRALIQNVDFRWEWYPGRGEIVSIGLFAKHFKDPIERVYQGTSGTRIITYVNAASADNRGVELEFRKGLGMLGGALKHLDLFTNATVMKSTIHLDAGSGSVTNANRKMVGQAPYVVNAGLTWTHPGGNASATALFNRVGERITEAGETPLPDVIEQPRNVLDLSLRFPVAGALSARLDAKNLLDAPYRLTQGSVVRESYRAGRVVGIGFSWTQ
ncbi:MAG: TonB-dependent receptor [Gemmatimonadales bacterium]